MNEILQLRKQRLELEMKIEKFLKKEINEFQKETGIGVSSIKIKMFPYREDSDGAKLYVVNECEMNLEI